MKNPFKSDRSDPERDNPVVPNVIERPVERAGDRAAKQDNPLVPNAIERPVERAAADDRSAVVDRPGIGNRDSSAVGAIGRDWTMVRPTSRPEVVQRRRRGRSAPG